MSQMRTVSLWDRTPQIGPDSVNIGEEAQNQWAVGSGVLDGSRMTANTKRNKAGSARQWNTNVSLTFPEINGQHIVNDLVWHGHTLPMEHERKVDEGGPLLFGRY